MERKVMTAFINGENASGANLATYSYRGTTELIEGRKLVAINLPSGILVDDSTRPRTLEMLNVVCSALRVTCTPVKTETLPESTCTF